MSGANIEKPVLQKVVSFFERNLGHKMCPADHLLNRIR